MATIEQLRATFRLDPETGKIYWKIRPKKGPVQIGDEAGTTNGVGYRSVHFDKKFYGVHRIVYALVHGEFPAGQIDHKNNIKTDNRPCNLRLASNAQNVMNRPASKASATGIRGVRWAKASNKWEVRFTLNGNRHRFGMFSDISDAKLAAEAAARKLFGEFAYRSEHA